MKKKAVIKYVAYLLLFAIQFAAVPFHQVFHKHKASTFNKSGLTSLKNFEKACCKPFDGIFGTTEPAELESSKLSFVRVIYLEPTSQFTFSRFVQSANKAPPVVIA
ncbi:MAG: hypothetical protein WKF66_08935 [Pedobacter sp.]